PRRRAPRDPGRSRHRAPPPSPPACRGHPRALGPALPLPPNRARAPPESWRPWTVAPARRRAATRGPRPAAGSLARRHRPHAGLVQQGDHHLVMEPLRPTQREVDHQIHVLATARLPLDLESRPAYHGFELVQYGGVRVGM